MNILITHAGGSGPVGIIKSLRDINFDGVIVAVDSDEFSSGMHLADVKYVVPKSNDDNFKDEILNIIKKENINLILPTGDSDLEFFARNSKLLKEMGVITFMSDEKSINICLDKWKFYKKCKDKFPLPKTFKGSKLFKKPIIGSGSRGCEMIEFNSNEILSEYLPGQEYTIDVLCDMDSNPLVVVPRKRLQTKAGVSSKGEIIKDEFIEKSCYDICKFLNLKGPICLQMKEDENGNPKFIEINPRWGGSSYFTTLAGINFIELIIKLINKNKININKPRKIKVIRHYEEICI
tara:strand:- start:303 stop:1178 length:876 start_codon:yes stop_codon:yes gene_type:complete